MVLLRDQKGSWIVSCNKNSFSLCFYETWSFPGASCEKNVALLKDETKIALKSCRVYHKEFSNEQEGVGDDECYRSFLIFLKTS